MPTYILTGAAGFIGAAVASKLLSDGHRVLSIDNLNDAYDVRLKEYRLRQLQEQPNFHCVHGDIADLSALRSLFAQATEKPSAVINMAARAGVRPSVDNPWIYQQTNTIGTLNLLEMCREYSVPKFILASTSSLYGTHNPQPYTEDANTDRPLSPYAASKKAAEVLCHAYHHLHGLDVTIFRFFTVYGPASRPDMSPLRFTQWIAEGQPVHIFGDGKQTRDFTYIDDIADGVIAGLKHLGYEIINLGNDEPIALLDMLHTLEELIGQRADLQFSPAHRADMNATWANIEKAKQLIQWQPRTSLHDGLEKLVQWYSSQRHWARYIETHD